MRAHWQGAGFAALLVALAAAPALPTFGQSPPPPAAAPPNGAMIYHVYCSFCHDDGTVGAPITGDTEAWRVLRERDAAALARSAWQGHPPMPARSLRPELTEERVRAAVDYMLDRLDAAKP